MTALRTATDLTRVPASVAAPAIALVPPPTATPERSLGRYALVLGQLVILVLLADRFQIEGESFRRLLLLAAGGFAIHYWLPLERRLPGFVLLSFAGIGVVLGPLAGAWLIALGLGLIGVCHLPIRMSARVALLAAIGVGLGVLRAGWGDVPWSSAVWPVLGAMFAMRLIVYLYDRSHETERPRFSQTLGYFFQLPNVCFPLFPVIDFKRFRRHYYDAERHTIYQVGVEWIWRGLLQLIVYRLVYARLTIDPVTVANLGQLLVYVLSTYLLYVRISGQFHIIIGILHLFGFNLPEAHHRYLLASSFTDFWRRINVYWKDFMLKVFYYPAFFRLNADGRSDVRAMVIATAFTFLATWALHSVQWFWIRGSFLLQWNDVIFWVILGGLVIVNARGEMRRRRPRAITRRRSLPESAGLVFRTIGTFAFMCMLWSFWTAESITDWRLMMHAARVAPEWTTAEVAIVAAGILAATAIAIVVAWRGWGAADQRPLARTTPAVILATTLMLCAVTAPGVARKLGQEEFVGALRSASLNSRDAEEYQRGYYENLLDVGSFNRELQVAYENIPSDFARSLPSLGLARRTRDAQDFELVPDRSGRFFGATVQTNRWGMRDRDYTHTPGPGVYRIALIGPSTAMGAGVEADQSFEALLERRLNDERPAGAVTAYEVLNFGVAGYSPLHTLAQLERKVLAFEPDLVLFVGHASDATTASHWWARMVKNGVLPKDAFNDDLLRRTGMTAGAGPNESRRRVKPYELDLLGHTYAQIAGESRAHGAMPVFAYMEKVTEPDEPQGALERRRLFDLAARAGFTVVDPSVVFHHRGQERLWIADNDVHPNAAGHRLLADELYTLLTTRGDAIGFGRPRAHAAPTEAP